MNIVKKLIKYNFTLDANKPEYLVIHDTANYSKGAGAEMHYQYFNSGNKNASAHLFVDDKQILQLIEFKDKGWHIGDGNNMFGINNGNSIGIEICVNPDSDYNKAVTNTVELVVYLMKTYNISLEKVVRHFDCSKKQCPNSMYNGNWSKWNEFKNRVLAKLNESNTPIPQQPSQDDILFKENLDWLVSYGKISSPDYWIANAKQGQVCKGEYVRTILTRFAELLKNTPMR